MAPTSRAWFCPGCGKHTAIIATAGGARVAVEYAKDGYTPTAERHVCGRERR